MCCVLGVSPGLAGSSSAHTRSRRVLHCCCDNNAEHDMRRRRRKHMCLTRQYICALAAVQKCTALCSTLGARDCRAREAVAACKCMRSCCAGSPRKGVLQIYL